MAQQTGVGLGLSTGIGGGFGAGGTGGFQVFVKTADGLPAIFVGADRATAETARDVYFGANPNDLLILDGNEFLFIQLVDESTDPDTVIYQNFRSPDFFDVSGVVTGPAGSASSLIFPSVASRQAFFAVTGNLTLLELNLLCVTNIGGVATSFVWTDPVGPVLVYDDTFWINTPLGASPDSLILGTDGARISSGNQIINFDTAGGQTQTLIGIPYTTGGGSSSPFCYVFTPQVTFNIADVDTSNLVEPQDVQADGFGLTSIYLQSIIVKPHETGILRIQAWIGTADTDPQIIDVEQSISGGDVGNETTIVIPNPVLLRTPEQNLFRFSGVGLEGGLQTSGHFNGQTVPFIDIGAMVASQVGLITQFIDTFTMREGPSNLATFTIEAANTTDKYVVQYADATSNVTTTYGDDGVIDLGVNHLDIVQTTGNITYTQNSVSSDFSVVSVSPEGNLTKNQGSTAILVSGDSSGFFFKQTGVGNTGWVEVIHAASGIVGPLTSTVNALPTWADGAGGSLNSFDNALLTNNGTITNLDIKSPAAGTGTSGFSVSNSLGTLKGELEYIESSDTVELLTTTAQLTFGQGPGAGTVEILGNDTEFLYLTGGNDNAFTIDMSSSPDTNPPFIVANEGSNGATINHHYGSRNPNTVVSGDPGAVYFRSDGTDSTVYVHADASTSVNNWVNLIAAGAGDVSGPGAAVVDNSLTVWNGTSAVDIQSVDNVIVLDDGANLSVTLNTPVNFGTASIVISDESGNEEIRISYDDNSNESDIFLQAATNLIQASGSDFTIQSTSSDVQIRTNNSSSQIEIKASGNDQNAVLSIEAEGANGALFNIFVGDRDPNGNVTGAGPDIYVRGGDTASRIYQNRTFSPGTTTWTELGNVITTQFGVDSTMIISNGTLQDIEVFVPVTTAQTGTTAFINIKSASASGTASGIQLTDTSDAAQSQFIYNELTDTVIITENTANPLTLSTLSGIVAIEPSGSPPSTRLTIESPASLNGCEVSLLNSSGVTRSRFFYDESTDRTAIDGLGTGGLDILSASTIGFAGAAFPDTTALMSWITTGSNGEQVDVFIGSRTPEGNVNANPGSVYFRRSGINSDIYVHRAATSGTTGWVDLFNTGVKSSETSTTNNALALWDGTDGSTIKQDPLIFSVSGASATALEFESPSVSGFVGLTLASSTSTTKLELLYSEGTDASTIDDESGNGLTILAASVLNLNSGSSDSVFIKGLYEFTETGTNSGFDITSPDANGNTDITFRNSAAQRQFRMHWDANADVASIEVFQDTTQLLITSDEQPVNIDVQITDANPILRLTNSENGFDIYSRSNNPAGSVTGTHGDIVVAGNGINNTAIFLQRESTSSSSWGQVELLQKQFEFVNSSGTLSRTHNRIIIDAVGDIVLDIPTPASTSIAEGFEQTVTKNISNTAVITIDTPGFYGHSGNFVMSQRGDTVSYLQTLSSNVILYTTRNVFAAMTRPLSAGETTINGFTGADIDLTIYTVNDITYQGLAEPDQANDLIDFPDVENLTSLGDEYLVELTVVVRWSNNEEITFNLFVDDAGIQTQYPLLMQEQSTGIADERTMHGRTLIRTGTNDTIALDTSIKASFRLITGAMAIFGASIFTVNKIEGK